MVRRPAILLLLLLAAPLAVFFVVSAFGQPGPVVGVGAIIRTLSIAGSLAFFYLLAALGFGRLFTTIARHPSVCAALGLGLMLTLSHLLGVLGLFARPLGPYIALAPIVIGVLLLMLRRGPFLVHRPLSIFTWMGLVALAAAPIAIACNPPGWLWASEFGGYDALSYHLQLPQEWLALGRIAPLNHNVYSYLPGYMEAAYTHLGVMSFAPPPTHGAGPLDVPAWGLLAGTGWRALSCQLLHAGFAILAAWCIASAWNPAAATITPPAATTSTTSPTPPPSPAAMAFMLALATPWTIVTGTLAYNEMPMLALFAAACTAALAPDLSPLRRWCIAGALIAAAACVKPTAIVLCGGPVGLLLLATTPPRKWILPGLAAAALGLVILSPWLLRNVRANGNPVFPFAAGLFTNDSGGTGHWLAEQVARYHAGHRFAGSLTDRLSLLFLPDATDPAGARMRGPLHPQWFALFPVALACLIVCLVKRARHAALWGGVLLLTLVLWLFTTHVQSRFLLPALVPACVLFAMAYASVGTIGRRALAACVLAQCGATLFIYADQGKGNPAMWIDLGPEYRSSEWARDELLAAPETQRSQWLREAAPETYCNLALPPQAAIRMVGGATPFYYSRGIKYNTTWDAWPIAAVLAGEAQPDADYLLVDFAEIDRLSRSGWIAPGVTGQALADWLRTHTEEVKSWRDLGVVLVRVRRGANP